NRRSTACGADQRQQSDHRLRLGLSREERWAGEAARDTGRRSILRITYGRLRPPASGRRWLRTETGTEAPRTASWRPLDAMDLLSNVDQEWFAKLQEAWRAQL